MTNVQINVVSATGCYLVTNQEVDDLELIGVIFFIVLFQFS